MIGADDFQGRPGGQNSFIIYIYIKQLSRQFKSFRSCLTLSKVDFFLKIYSLYKDIRQ